MPTTKEEAHTFPFINDSCNLPIIFNHEMTLSNPTLQQQFSTYSRHRLAFLSIQSSLMQIPGYTLKIPANSGTSQALSTTLLMILLTDLSKLSPQNRDPTVLTALGPKHMLKTPLNANGSDKTE
jgi:hypothetical protein